MEPRNLPIKIFHPRGPEDVHATEGGGDKTPPKWALSGEQLAAKAESLRAQVSSLGAQPKVDGLELPLVARVTVQEDALAKTHRPSIGALFSETGRGTESLIGLEGDLDLLVAFESPGAVELSASRFAEPEMYQVGISAVERVQRFLPVIEVPEENQALKVKLQRYQNPALNARVATAFEQSLSNAEVDFDKHTYAFDLDIYKVDPSAIELVSEFGALHSITPMPTVSARLDAAETEVLAESRKEPEPGEPYVTVGVLDSGIEPNDYLSPWIVGRFSPYPDEELDTKHGTATASVLLYGDELSQTEWVGAGAFNILDAAVFHRDPAGMDEDELVSNIQRAIERHPEIKIWMFAGGWDIECSDRDFSDFAKALDDLQKRFDVLVITSAGNCGRYLNGYQTGRVTHSGDTLMGVTVGSVTHDQPHDDHAPVGHRSPFSRVGPGPNLIVKPDMVHIGGNAGASIEARAVDAGVPILTPAGTIDTAIGTSFSTPRVAALAAGLTQSMDDDFSPLMVRALMIHSSHYDRSLTLAPHERLAELGYGRPRSVEEVLYNSPHESTLVLADRIEKGGYFDMFDFPFPDDLTDDYGYFRGEIIATLVSSPTLAPRQGAEYCQSDVQIKLGTYDHIKERDVSKSNIINPLGRAEAGNVLRKALYTTSPSRQSQYFTPERQLRDEHKKYHPVKKYGVNLAEMTPANRESYLKSPRRWFLHLRGLHASAAEVAADATGEILYQDFCLIVTVRDPLGQHNVYDGVANQLSAMNFPHTDVRVRAGVRVRVLQ